MRKQNVMRAAALIPIAMVCSVLAVGQTAPAPKRDITGIWDPERAGIGGSGAKAMPADGKHEPPYTAAGLAASKKNLSSNSPNPVTASEENDPAHKCEPQGFPDRKSTRLNSSH